MHSMPPGGFRLAIINCWNPETGFEVRERLAPLFQSSPPPQGSFINPKIRFTISLNSSVGLAFVTYSASIPAARAAARESGIRK